MSDIDIPRPIGVGISPHSDRVDITFLPSHLMRYETEAPITIAAARELRDMLSELLRARGYVDVCEEKN